MSAPTAELPSRDSIETVATYDDLPYYEEEDWVPRTKAGKQRSPNTIRNELQRYIDKTPSVTMTSIARDLGINGNTMSKFMNPKTYKDPWSAVQSSAYWRIAQFLERERCQQTSQKRSASTSNGGTAKKSKTARADACALMDSIVNTAAPNVSQKVVFDSCPEIIKKCKAFLEREGVTKASFCRALGNINNNSLGPFLMSKKQDGAGSVAYRRAWVFFEKQRLMEGQPKSKARIKNESEHPYGFSLEKPRTAKWVFTGGW